MKVILGVTGCIGAYKSALILRLLQEGGCDVVPVLTRSAQHFITPLTLEKLSGNRCVTDLFGDDSARIEHIALARESDLLLVAPATANLLAKFAHGIADDFLTTLYISTTTPVLVAPAMNVEMWRHPATRENVEVLRRRGVRFSEPASGYLACGEVGEGRLADPDQIVCQAMELLGGKRDLQGRRALVTAGPTLEDIDPVRYISNRSTGKMGYAIAGEAQRRGAEVVLVTGPTELKAPPGVEVVAVRSASEMAEAVSSRFENADVLVMAAAVSDFTPARASKEKIKKGGDPLDSITLQPTVDILELLGRKKTHQLVVGFAAESEKLEENALLKLRGKNLDLIVANDISAPDSGFGSDTNQAILLTEDSRQELPVLPKSEVAAILWDRLAPLLAQEKKRPLPNP